MFRYQRDKEILEQMVTGIPSIYCLHSYNFDMIVSCPCIGTLLHIQNIP